MLPGIGQRSVKSNYRKCQTLQFRDGVPLPSLQQTSSSEDCADGDLYRFRPPHLIASRPSTLSLQKPFIPKNVLYDRMMLRFDGYYMEEDAGYSVGKKTFRPVKVVYYLEDDTIAIHEPVTPNSGRPQGKLVQRHKVLKTLSQQQQQPSGEYGKNKSIISANRMAVDFITETVESPPAYWHWKDLNVGIDVIIFGRRYRLINCNTWTREFLTSAGIQVNAPEDLPESPHCSSSSGRELTLQETRSKSAPGRHQLKKFLEHDGHILRFGCVWDRRGEACVPPDERLKPYVLRYFLVDDTVQINDAEFESNQRRGLYGTNRAQEAVLLRRQKLPKEPRPILTSPADVVDLTFYDPSDLILGNVISVHGRRFILVETGDESTRNFYRTMFNVVDFTPIQLEY